MYIPLRTRTDYTFMESLIEVDRYIETAKELGYQSIGIIDQDHMYVAYRFIQQAKAAGLQPIVGIEMQLMDQELERELSVICIAKNSKGYRDLMKVSTKKSLGEHQLQEFYPLFTPDLQIIFPYFDGVDQLSYPFEFMVGVELNTPIQDFKHAIIPLHTVAYYSNQDLETMQVLEAVRFNVSLNEVNPIAHHQHLHDVSQMTDLFNERFPEAIQYLEDLCRSIDYQLDHSLKLPRFNHQIPAEDELRQRAEAGLKAKGLLLPDYQNRLDYELSVIHKMGFDDYFLIVWDLVRFGRERGYYMGMGRGSAAGSLVSFALEITGIDPIKNNLLFERFLNEERYSMPDIDIDIPDRYRNEFLHYVRDRYGSEHTAQIVTFSTFGAKQAIRDVFKRFGANEAELKNITSKIHFNQSLTDCYDSDVSFRQLINEKIEYQRAFEIAKKIEGHPRQTSIHAAGVVMSDDSLTNHTPLKLGDELYITQYDGPTVEANGLLKMDFLGLSNLTYVQLMREKLLQTQNIDIDIAKIDLEDKATLELFARGDTKGIFQFEASGAISLLQRIKPRRFEDVVATTSLNRPGASSYMEEFINRRFGKEAVDLIDPSIASILEPTYGIMLYQEQVMQIAQVYGGFSLGKADILRRAMSKKNPEEMHKMQAEFIEGAKSLGHDEQTAYRLFEMMEKFAGYGFNRSHAYAYCALAFQMAYFKCHYPEVFFDIMLNNGKEVYLEDALKQKFQADKLSINRIPYEDKIVDHKIVLGMKNIKRFPRDFAIWIINNRPYKSVEDFFIKLPVKYQKQSILEPIIKIGLFDEFEPNRRKILENLDPLFTFVNELGSLFADSSFNWVEVEDYSVIEKYQMEQNYLGIGISPHPLTALQKKSVRPFSMIDQLKVGMKRVTLLVQIERVHFHRTRNKGEQMAFLTVTDTQNKLSVTVFPRGFKVLSPLLEEDHFVYITGDVDQRQDEIQLLATQIEPVPEYRCFIQIEKEDRNLEQQLIAILRQYPGNIPVIVYLTELKEYRVLNGIGIEKSDQLLDEIQPIVMKTVFQ